MTEKLAERFDIAGYWKAGGRLDGSSLDKAGSMLAALDNGDITCLGNESSFAQAEGMAGRSRIELTPKQKNLYVFLREIDGRAGGAPAEPETPKTRPPWILSDQRLLAEVLCLTGDGTKWKSLKRAYPYIKF